MNNFNTEKIETAKGALYVSRKTGEFHNEGETIRGAIRTGLNGKLNYFVRENGKLLQPATNVETRDQAIAGIKAAMELA